MDPFIPLAATLVPLLHKWTKSVKKLRTEVQEGKESKCQSYKKSFLVHFPFRQKQYLAHHSKNSSFFNVRPEALSTNNSRRQLKNVFKTCRRGHGKRKQHL